MTSHCVSRILHANWNAWDVVRMQLILCLFKFKVNYQQFCSFSKITQHKIWWRNKKNIWNVATSNVRFCSNALIANQISQSALVAKKMYMQIRVYIGCKWKTGISVYIGCDGNVQTDQGLHWLSREQMALQGKMQTDQGQHWCNAMAQTDQGLHVVKECAGWCGFTLDRMSCARGRMSCARDSYMSCARGRMSWDTW